MVILKKYCKCYRPSIIVKFSLCKKNITLVDARKLSDPKYTEHETFNQQITIADTVVGNKRDLYQDEDEQKLTAYIAKLGLRETKLIFAEHGVIPFHECEGATRIDVQKNALCSLS